jgi:dienelactone hydrolase
VKRANGETKPTHRRLLIDEAEHGGLIFAPLHRHEATRTRDRAPVLYFLHGAGEAIVSKAKKQTPDVLLRNRSPPWHAQSGSKFLEEFVVICPQLERRRRWVSADATWLDDLVDAGVEEHTGDRQKLVLTGFSYGGEGVFVIAAKSRHQWAALWAVDPALQASTPRPPAGRRVLVHHGVTRDPVVADADLTGFIDDLRLQDPTPAVEQNRVVIDLETDHPGTCQAAYSEARVYPWLLGGPL